MTRFYNTIFVLLIGLSLCPVIPSYAQERCGITTYQNHLLNLDPNQEDTEAFEKWIERHAASVHPATNGRESVIQIPVVVHVIHKGETIGTGTNIPDDQIKSQIRVLNEDFNRLNADTILTPAEFTQLAGRIKIVFTLARQTPDGSATNGILRVRGTRSQWTTTDDAQLKAASYWPAENYLNLWVTDLSSELLGYAQFPVSTLSGLESASTNRLTDGVVIDYKAFGSADDGNFNLLASFSKGRVATHEIGHFLGLRHIWGDDAGGCGGSGDYVNDTPDQSNSTRGCPSQPLTTCAKHTMFQNYMDYTNDNCMNIFTQGQIDRIKAVLNNSPRRASLLVSDGLVEPGPRPNDLAVKDVISPLAKECYNVVAPIIRIANNGTNNIHNTTLTLSDEASVIETKTFQFTPALSPGETTDIGFSPFKASAGNHSFAVEITLTNGTADATSRDNAVTMQSVILDPVSLPFSENFDVLSSTWTVPSPAAGTSWQKTIASQFNGTNNALYLNFFGDKSTGQTYALVGPLTDLANTTSPYLVFDVAYVAHPSREDALTVSVLTDCSSDGGIEIYNRSGLALATAGVMSTAFIPSGAHHWRREVVDLRPFIDKGRIQILFDGLNGNGNNLYLDNVHIVGEVNEGIAIREVLRPTPVHCRNDIAPILVVENTGTVPIHKYHVQYRLNDGTYQTVDPQGDFSLRPGERKEVTLPSITLSTGSNSLTFQITDPNDLVDLQPNDNSIAIFTIVNSSPDKIPLRENFDSGAWLERWPVANLAGGTTWETLATGDGHALYYQGTNDRAGDAWLVSPVLNFSGTSAASLFFDLSSNCETGDCDGFKVYASRNCGVSYDELIFDLGEEVLSSKANSRSASTSADWTRKYINLSAFAGEGEVRFAFVASPGKFATYLDNIEFFTSDDPDPLSLQGVYALYGNEPGGSPEFYITFNLQERQQVGYELMDSAGRLVSCNQFDEVLNQTLEISPGELASGLYIVRLRFDGKSYSKRVYIGGQ